MEKATLGEGFTMKLLQNLSNATEYCNLEGPWTHNLRLSQSVLTLARARGAVVSCAARWRSDGRGLPTSQHEGGGVPRGESGPCGACGGSRPEAGVAAEESHAAGLQPFQSAKRSHAKCLVSEYVLVSRGLFSTVEVDLEVCAVSFLF